MSDYSEAELVAISNSFLAATTYLCDFHREQCWEHWTKDQKHDVSLEDGEKLLEMLRACAHAPPATEEGLEVDHHYKIAEALLKDSEIFKDNPQIKFWLNSTWLNNPQVCTLVYVCFYPN